MKYLAIALLKLYKATYSMEAYEKFGFVKGSLFTVKRLFRCAPWGKGGFDPVPANLKGSYKWHV